MGQVFEIRNLKRETAEAEAKIFRDDGATVEIIPQPNGLFTVRATYPEPLPGYDSGSSGGGSTGGGSSGGGPSEGGTSGGGASGGGTSGGGSDTPSGGGASDGVTSRSADLNFLHPVVRERVKKVLADCAQAGMPFRVFEAWRSPNRQNHLYAQGRTRPGNIVTYARAWESYHQYGLAADFVLYYEGQSNPWSWDDSGDRAPLWRKLADFGRSHGLEPLSFEKPHLQIVGWTLAKLLDGQFPDGGDTSWRSNLHGAISRWTGSPPAPPIEVEDVRPPLVLSSLNWSITPRVGSESWHSMHGGQEWRYDNAGIYLRSDPDRAIRSSGSPITVQAILTDCGDAIHKASIVHGIPPELIVMTVATEAAHAREDRFTGPRTFRWEAHVPVTDVTPQTHGDYSAGPMQTLATTAREAIRKLSLDYQPFEIAPYLRTQPSPAPTSNPLYDIGANVDIGAAEIRMRLNRSGFDPIKVSACFNAGGLYATQSNPWHLRSHGNHLNRAAEWFGDAAFVLATLRG